MINAAIKIYSYIQNIMKVITVLTILSLVLAANAFTGAVHQIHGAASKCIFNGVKFELLKLIPNLTNTTAAAELKHDLLNPTNQTMTSIDNTTWTQIRTFFGVPNPPNCPPAGQTAISGSSLSCLGIVWKYFVPLNGCT